MNVSFRVDVSQPVERFDGVAKAAQDPERILRRWSGYFRSQATRAAEEQAGWPAWSEATRDRYQQTRTAKITAAGQIREGYARRLTQHLQRKARQGVVGADSDLQELLRLRGGLRPDRTRVVTSRALEQLRRGLDRATTGKRVGGDKRQIARKRLLGRLPRMNVSAISGTTVKLQSRVPWSDVHNSGGGAGHGARIPARTWLEIDDQDRIVLAEIVRDTLLGGPR